jgi:hypothetical protein
MVLEKKDEEKEIATASFSAVFNLRKDLQM